VWGLRHGLSHCISYLLAEGCTEGFKVRFEKSDVAAHHTEVGDLFSFDPKVDGLNAHAQVHRRISDSERKFFVDEGHTQCASARGSDWGEVLWIHAYL